MVRFAATLAFLAAATSSAHAAFKPAPQAVAKVAKEATKANPKLRARELERKQSLDQKIRSLAVPKRDLQDGGDYDYQYNYDGDYWDQYMQEEDIGFDITNYAVKYTGCHTVQTYSDEMAQSQDSNTVLAADRFATFRLCPADQCYAGNQMGCNGNYGEYVVQLDQFLDAILGYNQQRVVGYCEYCDECASIESFKMFFTEVDMHREYALQFAEQQYEAWYQNYMQNQQDQYDAYGQYGDANAAQDDPAEAYWEYMSRNNYNNNYANNYVNGNYGNNGYNNQNQNAYNNAQYAQGANGDYGYTGYGNANAAYNNGNYQRVQNGGYWWRNNQNYANNQKANGNWADTQQFWDFEQEYQQENMNNWQNLNSNFGVWYGKKILNGYFSQDGEFVEGWGYFNGYGEFQSLEQTLWDETLFGNMPQNWDEDWFENADAIESCNQDYASSCYNQYDACMAILENNYQNQNNGNGNGYANNGQAYGAAQGGLADFLECTEIEMPEYEVKEGAGYYQAQYAQQYQYNKQQQQDAAAYCDNDDEDCWAQVQAQQEYNNKAQQYQMQQYQQQQQRRFFIGPRCGSNGRDISLGVYSDEFCSVVDEEFSVEDLMGYNPLEQEMNLFPSECITCQQEFQDLWYEDEEVQDQDQDGIAPMCSMLYQLSGKCNKHLQANEFNWVNNANANYAANEEDYKQMYQSQAQAENEGLVCSFIESLNSNSYDSSGQLQLNGNGWSSQWRNPENWSREWAMENEAMSPGAKAALVLSALAAAAMAVWACWLHGSLARKNIPWRPRRGRGDDPTDLARQNSGIVMGRSQSGPANAPLI